MNKLYHIIIISFLSTFSFSQNKLNLPFSQDSINSIQNTFGYKIGYTSALNRYNGILYYVKPNTMVFSPKKGKIIKVNKDGHGLGMNIIIQYSDNVKVKYYHLSKISVIENQIVNKNTLIGISGETGKTTKNSIGLITLVNDSIVNPNQIFDLK